MRGLTPDNGPRLAELHSMQANMSAHTYRVSSSPALSTAGATRIVDTLSARGIC